MYDYEKIALNELENKKLASTISCFKYLKLNKSFSTDDIKFIYQVSGSDFVAVAFPVLNNKVFLKVYINSNHGNVDEVVVEAGNIVSLIASSHTYTLVELEQLIGLAPTEGWSIGDMNGTRKLNFTSFRIIPDTNMAEYPVNKLEILLDYLEANRNAILKLIELCDRCLINIVSWNYYHEVEGLLLSNSIITRISSFNLALDFEPYLVENEI